MADTAVPADEPPPPPGKSLIDRLRLPLWQRILAATIAGVVLGVVILWFSLSGSQPGTAVQNGPWTTSPAAGSADAGPRLRAIVALRGLLALSSREAVYLNARTDSDGRPLDGACGYRVAGPPPASRWWSVTAYDGSGYLIANSAARYSVSGSGETAIDITIAPDGAIATAPGEPFELTLRAYNPLPQLLEGRMPVITRLAC